MSKQTQALLARLISLPVAGLGALLPMRWLDAELGVREFAFLTVVYALPMLFTFGELGYGGVASTAVGATRDHPDRAARPIGAIATLYLCIAAVLATAVLGAQLVAGTGSGGPGAWLGYPELGGAASVALVLAALGIPASLGARVLIGLDRTVLVVVLQALPAVLSATLIFTLLAADAPVSLLAGAFIVGGLLINLPLTVAGLRAVRARPVGLPGLRAALAAAGSPAWPNFASAVSAISLAQMPRLVLPHRGDDASVAELGLALIFFVPAASLVFVAGQALWSDFSHANARGELTRARLLGAARHSAVLGVVFAAGFAAVGPLLARLITPGVPAGSAVYLALAVLLLAFALDLPLNVAMLTGPLAARRGLLIMLQVPIGLLASLLVPHPSAALLVSIQTVSLVVVVLLPSVWLCLRRSRSSAAVGVP